MKREYPGWLRWGVPVGLALIGLFVIVSLMGESEAVGDTPPSPPSVEQEQFWAAVGLNDAWYIRRGYAESSPAFTPLPSAPTNHASRESSLASALDVNVSPRLTVDPQSVGFFGYADQPGMLTATVIISNGGSGTLTWVAELAPGGTFTPTLVPTNGLQGEPLKLLVDSSLYAEGSVGITQTRLITISANPSDTLDSPQVLTTNLFVDPQNGKICFAKKP